MSTVDGSSSDIPIYTNHLDAISGFVGNDGKNSRSPGCSKISWFSLLFTAFEMGFDDIPEEVLVQIFRFLSVSVVGQSCARVSKFWEEASNSDVLWNYFTSRDGLAVDSDFQSNAKEYYKENCTKQLLALC